MGARAMIGEEIDRNNPFSFVQHQMRIRRKNTSYNREEGM